LERLAPQTAHVSLRSPILTSMVPSPADPQPELWYYFADGTHRDSLLRVLSDRHSRRPCGSACSA